MLKTETASISGVDPYIVMAISQLETNDYNSDFFSGILTGLLPFFMQLMFVLPLYRMLDRVVGEKNSRIRESMRMMGLKDSAYWLSWFVYYLIINTFIAIFALIILGIQVMPNTDKFLLFLFFWCFGLSLFGYAVFTQPCSGVPKQLPLEELFSTSLQATSTSWWLMLQLLKAINLQHQSCLQLLLAELLLYSLLMKDQALVLVLIML